MIAVEKTPARETVHKVCNEREGIMNIRSSGTLLRNRAQVYNISKEMKKNAVSTLETSKDLILQALAKTEEEQQGRMGGIFIR